MSSSRAVRHNPAPATTFTTSRGSVYTVVDHTKTTRFKVAHAYHAVADMGEKRTSELTVYVPGARSRELGGSLGGAGPVVAVVKPDSVMVVAFNPVRRRWSRVVAPMTYQIVPQEGLCPLEFWDFAGFVPGRSYLMFGNWHNGSVITSIQGALRSDVESIKHATDL